LICQDDPKNWLKASAIAAVATVGAPFLVNSASNAAYFAARVDPLLQEDALRAVPILVLSTTVQYFITTLASAGLFAMAVQEANGVKPSLQDFWSVFQTPWRWLSMAIMGALAWTFLETVLVASNMPAITWAMLLLPLLFAPFYCFMLPLRLTSSDSPVELLIQNIRLGTRHYFRLLWLVFTSGVVSAIGILLCGIGYVLTQPYYQRNLAPVFLELTAPVDSESAD
jgi:hypothetical protein